MSLILYYRDCFTADKAVINEVDYELQLDGNISKTYLSPNKRFAGMCCGKLLNVQQWSDMHNIFDHFKFEIDNGKLVNEITPIFEIKIQDYFDKLHSENDEIVHMYLAFSEYLLECIYFGKKLKSKICKLDINKPRVSGSGMFAAIVLINSQLPLTQKNFFEIVAMSSKCVSREFTFIELKDVIGTPWYRVHQKSLKQKNGK